MRPVKDGLPAPCGEGEESEDPHWTRAAGDHLARPQGRSLNSGVLDGHNVHGKDRREEKMSVRERRTYHEQVKTKTDDQE